MKNFSTIDSLKRTKWAIPLLLMLVDAVLIFCIQFVSLAMISDFPKYPLTEAPFWHPMVTFLPIHICLTVAVFAIFGMYSSLWEYAGIDEAVRIVSAAVLTAACQYLVMWMLQWSVPKSFPFLNAGLLSVIVGLERFSLRLIHIIRQRRSAGNRKRTLLIGAGAAGAIALQDINYSGLSKNQIVCIIDDDPQKQGRRLRGIPIVGGTEDIPAMAKRYRAVEILFAIPTASPSRRREIMEQCQGTGLEIKTVPSLALIADHGGLDMRQVRRVQIEDLLGRDSVQVNIHEIAAYVHNKTVLVTGGGGSIGSELCRQIAAHQPKLLIIFDIYENNAYEIQQELRRKLPKLQVLTLIGSIRDESRLEDVFSEYRPQIVLHAAAHKHVPLMEDSPREAVKNNVFGTRTLCRLADRYRVETFVQISTDKAVNPTNVMGATKRICEMMVQSYSARSETKFVCVRFGNVLGSNGSVIPLFRKQIEAGGPVTVTHKDIIRYFMTIPEAVSLVLQAGAYAKNGEIFVLDMGEPMHIDDLARKMIRLCGYEPDVDITVEYTGLRPGEKLYEELLLDEEGMQSTANHLIYIGQPLKIIESDFTRQLDALEAACHDPKGDVRLLLKEIVPTYHPEQGGIAPEKIKA